MVNLWFIAAGALAAAATALMLRRGARRSDAQSTTTSVAPVSEEWLANARGQGDQTW